MDASDKRLQAILEYTTDDDGVWLVYGTARVRLGFFATLAQALDAAETLAQAFDAAEHLPE